VLHALGIPYEILLTEERSIIVIPVEFIEKAKYELWQYDQENRKPKPRGTTITPVYQSGIPGAAIYVAIICLVAWLAGEALFNRDWFVLGRVDGELIRDGEWWRTITALTLHSGVRHLAGNIVFGVLFGLMAGRLVGSGVTWFSVVIASAAANFLNISLLESTPGSLAITAGPDRRRYCSACIYRHRRRQYRYRRTSRRVRLWFCVWRSAHSGSEIPGAEIPAAKQRHRRRIDHYSGMDDGTVTLGLMATLVVEFTDSK
jgi:membrane associated rhomboid family serine protease